jgi:AcrR family transcriptional regulator
MCLMPTLTVPQPRVVDDPVLRAAMRCFVRDGWIDMRALATEAGVGRATLYRRAGSRDQVLAEVLWQLTVRSLDEARRRTRTTGVERVVQVLHLVMRDVVEAAPLRAFLDRDPETALRILTTRDGGVQTRVVAAVEELILAELGKPRDVTANALAYAIVRIAESFCYADVLTGQAPDIDTAADIVRRLLQNGG